MFTANQVHRYCHQMTFPFWMSGCTGPHRHDPVCTMQLEEVYGEVFRVLKPGGMFCSYEWVATKEFDPNNAEHVRIIDEINFGNGLPVGASALRAPLLCCLAEYQSFLQA